MAATSAASGKLWPARVTGPPALVSLDSDSVAAGDVVSSALSEPELRSSPAHAVARKRVPTESTAARDRLIDMMFLLCPVAGVTTRVRMLLSRWCGDVLCPAAPR